MPDPSQMPVLASANFHVTVADVAAAHRAYMRWALLRPRTLVVAAVVGLALYGLEAIVNPRSLSWAHAIAGVAAAATILLLHAVSFALVPLLARRAYRRQPNMRHHWRVDLSEGGVRAVTPNQDSFVAWPDYVAWHEDPRVILLYQSERLFHLIPTKACSPEFQSALRGLLAGLPRR